MESLVPSKLHPQIAGIFVGNANGYRLQARLDACCLKGNENVGCEGRMGADLVETLSQSGREGL